MKELTISLPETVDEKEILEQIEQTDFRVSVALKTELLKRANED